MHPDDEPGPPAPNVKLARSAGIFTLILGLLLLLYVGATAAMVGGLPALDRFLERELAEERQEMEQRWTDRLEDYEEKLAEAEGDEQRALIAKDRELERLRRTSDMPPIGLGLGFFSDGRVQRAAWAHLGIMAALNLAMVVGAIGLIRLKGWGRGLSMVTAAAKVVALIALTLTVTRTSAPIMAERLAEDIEGMMAMTGEAESYPPAYDELMGRYRDGMARMFAASSSTMNMLGLLFPIVLLYVLGRRDVRAAFAKGPAPEPEVR